MGFDVNPPSNKPIIREAASMQNDGGGGNLGYFEQERKKENQRSQESIFGHKEEKDSFSKESQEQSTEEDFSVSKLIAEFIFSVKDWFRKLFSGK